MVMATRPPEGRPDLGKQGHKVDVFVRYGILKISPPHLCVYHLVKFFSNLIVIKV